MKTQLFRIPLFVFALVMASAAVAQRQPGDLLVNIPFSFLVGNHQMPSGEYVVTHAANGILRMSNTENPSSGLLTSVQAVESRTSQPPKLVFHRYVDSYFLSEVWTGDGRIGRQLPRSKAERELISANASGTHASGEVAEVRPER
jgi:hypothetical protein